MSDVMSHAGALGYLVVLGGLGGLVAAAGLAYAAFTKRRVPLTAVIAVPYLVLALGAIATWMAVGAVADAVGAAESSRIPVVAMSGVWQAMSADWLARWIAAFVLLAGTWAAAVGAALVTGPEPRTTPVAAGGAALVSLLGAVGVAAIGANSGLGMPVFALAGVVVGGGLGVALAATRRAADDEMYRVAGMRFVSSMAFLFAVYHAARAFDIGVRMNAFADGGALLTASDTTKAIELFSVAIDQGVMVMFVAVFAAIVVAFFGFFAEIGEVVVRTTMLDMFGVVGLMVLVGLVRLIEDGGYNSMHAVGTNFPAVAMYADLGQDLPTSALTRGEATEVVRVADGGFGDVYAFVIDGWERKFRWNDRTWREDDRKIDEVSEHADRPPLFAVERGMEADQIVQLMEKLGTDRAYLLLRASEVKAGTFVPPDIARLQTTYLPIQISKERDLKTQLWMTAGSPEVNWGPTTWFGDKDDSLDPVDYASAAVAATSSPGVHLLVKSRKVADIVTSCMPYLLDSVPAGETTTLALNDQRWCAISAEEYEVVRKEAAGLWELPLPKNVKMNIRLQGAFDQAQVDDLVRRELGGLGYCAEKATAAGEPLKGAMALQLAVSKDGQVYDTSVDPASSVQSPTILRCASKRFRKLAFTMPDPATLPPPPPPAPVKKGQPPAPTGPLPPRVFVTLEFI